MMSVKMFFRNLICLLNREFPTEILVKRGMEVGENFKRFSGCIILPNVVIGEGSIVGARSVVSCNVPPYTVVAGNPARVTMFYGRIC